MGVLLTALGILLVLVGLILSAISEMRAKVQASNNRK